MNDIIEMETGAIAAVSKKGPDEQRTKRKADALVELANSMEVKTQADYDLATGELRTIIEFHAELEAERTGFTGPLNAILDKMNARFQPYLKALRGDGKKGSVSAESIIKGKMIAFLGEQERLAADARRKAEADAQAERNRQAEIAAEQRRIAEAAEAEAAAARGKKAKAEAEARAEAARRSAAAAETTAAVVIAQPVAVAVSRGRGISTPKGWDFEVENKLALAEHIVKFRPDLIVLFEVDAEKMRMHVKMQGAATMLPGVRVFEKTGITVR